MKIKPLQYFCYLTRQNPFSSPGAFPVRCSRLKKEISELSHNSNQTPQVHMAQTPQSTHTRVSSAQVNAPCHQCHQCHCCSLSLPGINFPSQFLVDLDWFILVVHFAPHIQLKSPLPLDFYKNIHFSKAEKEGKIYFNI